LRRDWQASCAEPTQPNPFKLARIPAPTPPPAATARHAARGKFFSNC
jgi:hypothetical protein